MELVFERHEHITAPAALVWDEVGSLEQLLAKSHQAQAYEVTAGGERATFQVHLAWGPVKWAVDGTLTLADCEPEQRLVYRMAAPSLDLTYEGRIELTAVGAETKLAYHGQMECRHRMAGRLRSMFNDLIEEHMYGILNRAKVRAEQRRLAQERLLS